MNKIHLLFLGITLTSAISASIDRQTIAANTEAGTLALVANGEDFVRQGFTSKDGWDINFDHIYINIGDATAYSTASSFEPQKGDTKNSIDYQEKVDFLSEPQTTDLAAGDASAEPIVVKQVDVNDGFYADNNINKSNTKILISA